MPPDRVLAHAAAGRGILAVRGLRRPPHQRRRRDPDCKSRSRRSRSGRTSSRRAAPIGQSASTERGTKPPKPIRPVSNGFGPSGTTWARTAECTPSAPITKSPSAVVPSVKWTTHRPVAAILDGGEPLLEMQLDIAAPGLVDQHFVQRGAAHVDRGLAEARLHVAVERAEQAAGLRIEVEGFATEPRRISSSASPISASTCMPLGAICRPPPIAGGVGPCLVQFGLVAGLFKENRGNRAGNAGADDQGLAGTSRHGLLLGRAWGTKLQSAKYLSG